MSVITSKNDRFHNDTIIERGRFFITTLKIELFLKLLTKE